MAIKRKKIVRQAKQAYVRQDEYYRKLKARLGEGILIFYLALCTFFSIALMSYNSEDNGWSHINSNPQITNLGGVVGAWLADVVLYLFGYVGYLIPVLFAMLGIFIYRNINKVSSVWGSVCIYRLIGLTLTLLAGSGLLELTIANVGYLPYHSGGIAGQLVTMPIVEAFSFFGSVLVLAGLLLCGSTLFSGISWLRLLDFIGAFTLYLLHGIGKIVFSQIFFWSRKAKHFISEKLSSKAKLSVAKEPNQEEGKPEIEGATAAIGGGRKWLSRLRKTKVSEQPSDRQEPMFSVDKQTVLNVGTDTQRMEHSSHIAASLSLDKSHVLNLGVVPTPSLNNRGMKSSDAQIPKKILKLQKSASPNKAPIEGTLPAITLLDEATPSIRSYSHATLEAMSREVELRLNDFGVQAKVVAVHPGPVITRFELQLAPGTKASKISGLAKDLARSLSVISVRVVEVIAGKSYVGLEIPNADRQIVRLSEILASQVYQQARSPLSLALGKDIAGYPVVVDLAKMPHLLVAGTTGAGKSVGLNAMILSFLYKALPHEVRMIMIDPKMLELSVYEGIPHLLCPVVTDMKDAANALRWCVTEMDRRYRLMANLGVRNLAGYNQKIQLAEAAGAPLMNPFTDPALEKEPLLALPHIVIVIDEFADMMLVVGKKVEELIARLAQKARAAGIHMILATQRPSVDVITGLIKANIPTRIAYQVSSKIDSRTILDQQGAEQLLGQGDLLYLASGSGLPVRVHGAYLSDEEVHRVVNDWKKRGEPDYQQNIFEQAETSIGHDGILNHDDPEADPLYDQAVQIVVTSRRATISSVQRRLKIGYNRAARLIEAMESAGLVSAMQSNGNREVLIPESET